jgi:hypothetical protein
MFKKKNLSLKLDDEPVPERQFEDSATLNVEVGLALEIDNQF